MDSLLAKIAALFAATCLLLVVGCTHVPYQYGIERAALDKGQYPELSQQFYQGAPSKVLDAADWYWPNSLLAKLLLWDRDVDSHQITEPTLDVLKRYIDDNQLTEVQVLVNTYKPGNQWRRLFNNHTVGAGWRYTLGVLSVSFYTILPGRFFGGDAYNPFTNTIYLYSDDPSIALHEAGHAKDFARREYKGSHAALYSLPFAALYYEAKASTEALSYLQQQQKIAEKAEAYELLYPAYATYVSGNLLRFSDYAAYSAIGVIPGHIAGQIAAHSARKKARLNKNQLQQPAENGETNRSKDVVYTAVQ